MLNIKNKLHTTFITFKSIQINIINIISINCIKFTFYIAGVFKMIYEHNKLFIEIMEFQNILLIKKVQKIVFLKNL